MINYIRALEALRRGGGVGEGGRQVLGQVAPAGLQVLVQLAAGRDGRHVRLRLHEGAEARQVAHHQRRRRVARVHEGAEDLVHAVAVALEQDLEVVRVLYLCG